MKYIIYLYIWLYIEARRFWRGLMAKRRAYVAHASGVQKVPMHSVRHDDDTYVSRRSTREIEGQYFYSCHATRQPHRRSRRDATRRDGLTTHASRPAAAFSICLSAVSFVLPIAERRDRRDAAPGRNAPLFLRVLSRPVDDVYVVSQQRHGPREMITIIAHSAESRPNARRPATSFLLPLPLYVGGSRYRRTSGHVRGRRFFVTISRAAEASDSRIVNWILSRAIVQSLAEIISASVCLPAIVAPGHRFRVAVPVT